MRNLQTFSAKKLLFQWETKSFLPQYEVIAALLFIFVINIAIIWYLCRMVHKTIQDSP